MGCKDASLGGWIFLVGPQDGSNSNDGNRCLWLLSGPTALGVPSFPPPPLWSSSAALPCGLVQRRGGVGT